MSTVRRLPRFLNLQPHHGSATDLVIGIDVGTTFSGVSYAVLRPDMIPEVQAVSGKAIGDSKIPSIMYFDKQLELKAAGASATTETIELEAQYENWKKVEHFKMHLRPSNMLIDTNGLELGTLPPQITAVQAMSHFLRYLYNETIKFIVTREPDGTELIRKVEDRILFVLSHPNGWQGLPQQQMREAAILAGMIPDSSEGRARVRLVTEGEASALACLANGLCPPNLQAGYRFMVADAGGGTLDITTYEITRTSPLQLKELTSSDCSFAGGVFVNSRMGELLKERLRGSRLGNPDELLDLIKEFEHSLKRQFDGQDKIMWMKAGQRSENDRKRRIRGGALAVEKFELMECFKFSMDSLLESIESQITASNAGKIPVWLVGGFAASPWLLFKVSEALKKQGISVSRPDTNLAKAVANGNVLYALDSTVTSRVTRMAYGIECNHAYHSTDPEHARRSHLCFENLDGQIRMPSVFSIIVNKNVEVDDLEKYKRSYIWLTQDPTRTMYECTLICYGGYSPAPMWYDENKDLFLSSCTIKADLANLFRPECKGKYKNRSFWRIPFDIEISFGQVELQARFKWVENGVEKYGPASIFYDE